MVYTPGLQPGVKGGLFFFKKNASHALQKKVRDLS